MARKKRKISKAVNKAEKMGIQRKVNLSWKYFLLFLLFFIASFAFYRLSVNPLMVNLFGMAYILFGVLMVAFLIAFFAFVFLKWMNK